jgi:hypothetical protein
MRSRRAQRHDEVRLAVFRDALLQRQRRADRRFDRPYADDDRRDPATQLRAIFRLGRDQEQDIGCCVLLEHALLYLRDGSRSL